ncbi:MAG: DUF3352 domain-containing protein, partial [Chlamydiota bacterium]|nr:DUF3352 domain-containing protein [Chlamydiota bacterium]
PKINGQEKINQIMNGLQGAVTVETVNYNGYSISRVRNAQTPGPEFNYVFLGDLLVIGVGLDDSGVRQVVDLVAKKTTTSLSASNKYNDALGALKVRGDVRGLFYINMQSIVDLIKAFPAPAGAAAFTQNIDASLGAIQSISGAVGIDNGVVVKMFFMKNADGKQAASAIMPWDSPPAKAETLKLLPEGSLLFTISKSMNVKQVWDTWKTNLEQTTPDQATPVMEAISKFESESGINIEEDLINVVSDEIALTLLDVDMSGLFPFPQLAVVLKIQDEAKAKTSMDKVVQYVIRATTPSGVSAPGQEGAEEQAATQVASGQEDYNNVTVHFVQVQLPYQNLNPSYAIINGYLVVGINKESVKVIIDVLKGNKPSISKNDIYRSSTQGFSEKVNQLAFLNLDKAMNLIIQITTWANNLQRATGAAAVTEETVQQNVLPILESLKVLKAIAVEAVNREKGIEETMYIQIEDIRE